MSGDVLISWYECNCEWTTKFCDEEHVKRAVVDRAGLDELINADLADARRKQQEEGR